MEFTKNQKLFLGVLAIIAISIIGYYIFTKTEESGSMVLEELYQEETNNSRGINEEINLENDDEIIIHIAGMVNEEGIVKVKDGARIADVIELAQGLMPEADISEVNLAYRVQDGQKIYIPKKGENVEKIDSITSDAGVVVKDAYTSTKDISLVNINTATQTELETLTGIGPSTALKIIEYRTENGKYKTIEDLKNVSGIGDVKFKAIKDDICVD